MRREENFNICGAIKRIIYQADKAEKLKVLVGTQLRTDKVRKPPEFKTTPGEEVQAHGLVVSNVKTCVRHLYCKVVGNEGKSEMLLGMLTQYPTCSEPVQHV
ncbi:hypothetical protein HOY80DRAFT_1049925 [Tuber brumale]|nr:hypothetical protein HOY80DRAFT_1049925 [Tuber brumale]